MADLSLDDFIRKNNVKVQINNRSQTQAAKNLKQRKPVNLPQKLQGIQTKTQKKLFDARQKIGPKAVPDARDKIIINRKSGLGDARSQIVHKQVEKGTFDARSLLQRQTKKSRRPGQQNPDSGDGVNFNNQVATPGVLTRTLSNPGARGKSQIKVTNSGLQVTRPVPSANAVLYGSSLQVPKKARGRPPPPISDAVPIIQIRNDRYKPTQEPPSRSSAQYYSQEPTYSSQTLDYSYTASHYDTQQGYGDSRGTYRDLDDPMYNAAHMAVPEVPRVHISNLRPVEPAGMRPISYSRDPGPPASAPLGAASVSLTSRSAAPKMARPLLKPAVLGAKRKAPQGNVSGPLRLGKGGGPGIDLGGMPDTSPSKKSKLSSIENDLEVEELDNPAAVVSPLQGFRIMVTNLFSQVTQDDIIELFGAVGPLKKAKLLKPGSAEVVYVSKADALSAVQKYHSRELDGQPMVVKMTTPVAAVVKMALGERDPDITGEALKLYKKQSGASTLPEAPIEVPTIHRALFKAGPPAPNKSVKFTVKI